jgi:type II secretory ATPase GspE/PulE/Tfp pilus assembly ATPase PilB-like protein
LDVLGSVLLGILAQRLLRLLCKHCKVVDTSEDTMEVVNETYVAHMTKHTHKAGDGCPNCDYTGYRGRRMIYELLLMTPRVREALEKGEPPSVIARHGMAEERTMWSNGVRLVAEGLTSAEELHRVATRNR